MKYRSYSDLRSILWLLAVILGPLLLALWVLKIPNWDLSVPMIYTKVDDIWQLVLTKVLCETGWVLQIPSLGAPGIASWHHNAAAQTSALHSVLMYGLSLFIDDAVRVQQIYYLLNFSLISLTSYIASRLLGLNRLPAFCTGMIYSFTTFRITAMLYAYIPNYFMVPLALVPVVWIMSGVFRRLHDENDGIGKMRRILCSREFLLGLAFIVLMSTSDGYYAFFTLILLGFAGVARVVSGDWRAPLSLLPTFVFIGTLFTVVLALNWPLHAYKKSHRDEFYPNGVEDATLIKRPFEAEVYSTTLKMLISPNPKHQIKAVGDFGLMLEDTDNAFRLYKRSNSPHLGTTGSVLLAACILFLIIPNCRRIPKKENNYLAIDNIGHAFLSLSLFIFLCSITGGIGTLIAVVFPTIRAYDRFPIFLIFVIFAAGGYWFTHLFERAKPLRKRGYVVVLGSVTAFTLWDQIPSDAAKGNPASAATYLAERRFVAAMEATLPPRCMVYQYPYSQYLTDNAYYGWGVFSHVRLYLHSRQLRWSNGAAKNSPIDLWHTWVARLSPKQMLAELRAVGFAGLVVDRTVVERSEYEDLREALLAQGSEPPVEDSASKLAFFRLSDPGYRVVYDNAYKEVERIDILDRSRLAVGPYSLRLNPESFQKWLANNAVQGPRTIERSAHPELIVSAAKLKRGNGDMPISPLTDLRGEIECSYSGIDTLLVTIRNNSDFDWSFNQGSYPLGIGVHLFGSKGTTLRWDDGWRLFANSRSVNNDRKVHAKAFWLPAGGSEQFTLPIQELQLGGLEVDPMHLEAELQIVQDGNAWFAGCRGRVNLKR